MGDMGDIYNAMKERSREKRASNRQTGAVLLCNAGVRFEERNAGAHLIVSGPSGKIDYWPGTGLWIERKGRKREGRGVFKLMAYIGANAGPPAVERQSCSDAFNQWPRDAEAAIAGGPGVNLVAAV